MDCTQELSLTQEVDCSQRWSEGEKVQVAYLEAEGKRYPIHSGTNKIGRDADVCDVVLDSKALSKVHCTIEVESSKLHTIYDMESRNKTKLGQRYLKPHVKYDLQGGDKIRLADVMCTYVIGEIPQEKDLEDSGSDTDAEISLHLDESEDLLSSPSKLGDVSMVPVTPAASSVKSRLQVEKAAKINSDAKEDSASEANLSKEDFSEPEDEEPLFPKKKNFGDEDTTVSSQSLLEEEEDRTCDDDIAAKNKEDDSDQAERESANEDGGKTSATKETGEEGDLDEDDELFDAPTQIIGGDLAAMELAADQINPASPEKAADDYLHDAETQKIPFDLDNTLSPEEAAEKSEDVAEDPANMTESQLMEAETQAFESKGAENEESEEDLEDMPTQPIENISSKENDLSKMEKQTAAVKLSPTEVNDLEKMDTQPIPVSTSTGKNDDDDFANMATQPIPISTSTGKSDDDDFANMATQPIPISASSANNVDDDFANMATQPIPISAPSANNNVDDDFANMATQPIPISAPSANSNVDDDFANMATQPIPISASSANNIDDDFTNMATQPIPVSSPSAKNVDDDFANMATQPIPVNAPSTDNNVDNDFTNMATQIITASPSSDEDDVATQPISPAPCVKGDDSANKTGAATDINFSSEKEDFENVATQPLPLEVSSEKDGESKTETEIGLTVSSEKDDFENMATQPLPREISSKKDSDCVPMTRKTIVIDASKEDEDFENMATQPLPRDVSSKTDSDSAGNTGDTIIIDTSTTTETVGESLNKSDAKSKDGKDLEVSETGIVMQEAQPDEDDEDFDEYCNAATQPVSDLYGKEPDNLHASDSENLMQAGEEPDGSSQDSSNAPTQPVPKDLEDKASKIISNREIESSRNGSRVPPLPSEDDYEDFVNADEMKKSDAKAAPEHHKSGYGSDKKSAPVTPLEGEDEEQTGGTISMMEDDDQAPEVQRTSQSNGEKRAMNSSDHSYCIQARNEPSKGNVLNVTATHKRKKQQPETSTPVTFASAKEKFIPEGVSTIMEPGEDLDEEDSCSGLLELPSTEEVLGVVQWKKDDDSSAAEEPWEVKSRERKGRSRKQAHKLDASDKAEETEEDSLTSSAKSRSGRSIKPRRRYSPSGEHQSETETSFPGSSDLDSESMEKSEAVVKKTRGRKDKFDRKRVSQKKEKEVARSKVIGEESGRKTRSRLGKTMVVDGITPLPPRRKPKEASDSLSVPGISAAKAPRKLLVNAGGGKSMLEMSPVRPLMVVVNRMTRKQEREIEEASPSTSPARSAMRTLRSKRKESVSDSQSTLQPVKRTAMKQEKENASQSIGGKRTTRMQEKEGSQSRNASSPEKRKTRKQEKDASQLQKTSSVQPAKRSTRKQDRDETQTMAAGSPSGKSRRKEIKIEILSQSTSSQPSNRTLRKRGRDDETSSQEASRLEPVKKALRGQVKDEPASPNTRSAQSVQRTLRNQGKVAASGSQQKAAKQSPKKREAATESSLNKRVSYSPPHSRLRSTRNQRGKDAVSLSVTSTPESPVKSVKREVGSPLRRTVRKRGRDPVAATPSKKQKVDAAEEQKRPASQKNLTKAPALLPSKPSRSSQRQASKRSESDVEESLTKTPGASPSPLPRKRGQKTNISRVSVTTRKKAMASFQEVSLGVPSSPSLRHKIMFTGFENLQQEKKIVKELGGNLTEASKESTVLVTDAVRRTVKFLCIMGRGLPIVSTKWLVSCKQAKCFLDPWDFILEDKEMEKRFKFNLVMSLKKAAKSRLLTGYTILVTPHVRPPPQEMKEIIHCAGGVMATSIPKNTSNVFAISCPEDRKKWAQFQKIKIPVLSCEVLLTGLLQQKLKIDEFSLT